MDVPTRERAKFRPVTAESRARLEEESKRLGSQPIVPDQPATMRQLRYLQAVAGGAGYDAAALDNRAMQEFGVEAKDLTRRDASTLIDVMQAEDKNWKTV